MSPDSLDNYDPALVERLIAILGAPARRYFRVEVRGLDLLPNGPALVVGNHNAGITFLEPFFLGAEWHSRTAGANPLFFLTHDTMLALPGLGRTLMRVGCVRASMENSRRILALGRKLVVFPGGNYEAFRPFAERNRVDFGGHQGFARLALETGVPVLPMASVGGHETFFVISRGARLARLLRLDKLLRSSTCPVMVSVPWGLTVGPIFHLPLPAKCVIEIGEPILPSSVETGSIPQRADALYRRVTGRLQTMVDRIAAGRSLPVLG